jgi:hypothetical protein
MLHVVTEGQCPFWHADPPQELPHEPQFKVSVMVLTHCPSQNVKPDDVHSQKPLMQVVAFGQTIPHWPQLEGSDEVEVHRLEQMDLPIGQLSAHWALTQVAVAPDTSFGQA